MKMINRLLMERNQAKWPLKRGKMRLKKRKNKQYSWTSWKRRNQRLLMLRWPQYTSHQRRRSMRSRLKWERNCLNSSRMSSWKRWLLLLSAMVSLYLLGEAFRRTLKTDQCPNLSSLWSKNSSITLLGCNQRLFRLWMTLARQCISMLRINWTNTISQQTEHFHLST